MVRNRRPPNGDRKPLIPPKRTVSETAQEDAYDEHWCPKMDTCLHLLLAARLSAALWSTISDCDETFNYWEPIHFFIYGKGFQTWEYSPEYGLRSYFYILLHTVPAWIYERLLNPHPLFVFYFLRCLLGMVSAFCEAYFVQAVKREAGAIAARLTLALLALSAGMFVASTALLPSTTSMYLTMLSMGAWFNGNLQLAILFTAMSAFLSWPFAAILGVPIALDILFVRFKWLTFFRWCAISVATILVPQVIMDSSYYGRVTVAPLNIVMYNIFTPHGPDLYGTEPWTFYFVNGFLNFNVVFFLALVSLPLAAVVNHLLPRQRRGANNLSNSFRLLGLFIWFGIFFLQPHKEERFLFPVYPLICLSAALALEAVGKIANRLKSGLATIVTVSTLGVYTLLCFSRMGALQNNYVAPFQVWDSVSKFPGLAKDFDAKWLESHEGKVHVCVGKEWYRFPNSFFLPNTDWEVKWLRSEFRGQLPTPYLKGENATAAKRTNFNNMNREEMDRYVRSVDECDFIVDLETGVETEFEPSYSRDKDRWELKQSFPFLDSAKSHKILRAFYVPNISDSHNVFNDYVLLRSKRMRRSLP